MIRDLMIGGASVEDMLTLWASSLREAKQRMRPLFTQERVAISAGQFFDGLLGNEPRKTGWMRAETAGDKGPWRQQAILGRGRWDADACAMWCVSMHWKRCPMETRFLSSTKPAF
jgi:SRSO17 transposase